jgi:hypothetical protein
MKKCKALYPIAGSRTAWVPCVRKAERGSEFCRRHGDAIFGAMLGAVIHEPESNDETALEKDEMRRDERRVLRRK